MPRTLVMVKKNRIKTSDENHNNESKSKRTNAIEQ